MKTPLNSGPRQLQITEHQISPLAVSQNDASAKTVGIRPGQTWACTQRRHSGWVVRILNLTATSVRFVCCFGPGHTRGTRHSMRSTAFVQCYRLRSGSSC
jgi:hypothetical protein